MPPHPASMPPYKPRRRRRDASRDGSSVCDDSAALQAVTNPRPSAAVKSGVRDAARTKSRDESTGCGDSAVLHDARRRRLCCTCRSSPRPVQLSLFDQMPGSKEVGRDGV